MTVSKDVRLNVIAETRKYQQELAKIPGVTEKQAGLAARRWEKALTDGAVRAAKEQERQAVRVRKQQEKAADAAADAQIKAAKTSGDAWADFGTVFAANLSADAILAAAASIYDFASGIAEARTETINLADATGVSLATLAGLDVAARRVGLTASEITGGFEDFGEVMFDFSNESGRAVEAMSALDIDVRKVGGGLRDTDDVLREVLNKLPKVADEATRNAFAQQLFGDAGNRLNAALGDRALDDYITRARLFGTVIDGDAVAATSAWNEALADLSMTTEAIGGVLFDVFGEDMLRDLRALPEAFVILRAVGVTAMEGLTLQAGLAASAFEALFRGDFAAAAELANAAQFDDDLVSLTELGKAALDAQAAYRGLSEELSGVDVEATKTKDTLDQLKDKQAAAAASARSASADQAAAAKEQAKAAADFERGIKDIAAATTSLADIEAKANADKLSNAQKILDARDAELGKIDLLEARIGDAAAADAARAAVIMRTTRDIQAIEAEAREVRNAANLEDDETDEQRQARRLANVDTWATASADALATVADLAGDSFGRRYELERDLMAQASASHDEMIAEREALNTAIEAATDSETRAALEADRATLEGRIKSSEEILAAQQSTARKVFAQRKAMEIASIIITGAAAALGALLPPPVGGGVTPIGAVMAATAATATAGAVATVASQQMPQFDAGFASFTKGPDNFAAILRDGEGVTNQRATEALGGPAGVQQLNQTGSVGGQSMVVRLEMAGRDLGRAVVDEMRAGRELSRHLTQGRRVGVRPVFMGR